MDKNYKKYLNNLIPDLKAYPVKSGAEGSAYFVDKEFVVKYFERVNLEFKEFDNYCNEIQRFGDGGFACPKIYSWARVPICEVDKVYRCYILQEQVPGDVIFPYSINEIEPRVKKFCSKDEFMNAISSISENKSLYTALLNEYSKMVLKKSERLESLSRDEIRKFIETYIHINKNSVFSLPDMHVGNVLTDGNKITLIDECMVHVNPNRWLDCEGNFRNKYFKYKTLSDLIYLFSSVRNVQSEIDKFQRLTKEKVDADISKNWRKNKKVLGEFMQVWAKECKNLLVYDNLNEAEIESVFWSLEYIVNKKSEQNIIAEFSREK